jgi:hypothetical protein
VSTEAEREALRQRWRKQSGSQMSPIATAIACCPECNGTFCAKEVGGVWRLNDHGYSFFLGGKCPGSGRVVEEVKPL